MSNVKIIIKTFYTLKVLEINIRLIFLIKINSRKLQTFK